jgi:phosphoglucosamine mutase
VDGDQLLFIIARHLKEINKLSGGIVGTAMTNLGFEEAMSDLNIPFERTSVGDRYVMSRLKQNKWQIGGESSGHIVHLALSTTGDGIISALQVLCALIESGRSLADLKSGMVKYPQVLLNVPISKSMDLNSPSLQEAIRETELKLGRSGRVLLRASGTEPVVRVMVEGQSIEQVESLAQGLARTISESN